MDYGEGFLGDQNAGDRGLGVIMGKTLIKLMDTILESQHHSIASD